MKNVNIIFYGIGRASSARRKHYKHLIKILAKNYTLNIIEILNDIKKITNPRSNEFSLNLKKEFINKQSYKIIRTFKNNKEVKKLMVISRNFEDVHYDNYQSVFNLLQQLSMLIEATKHCKPGLVLAIRDDLLFNARLLIKIINKTSCFIFKNKKIFITSFFHSNTGICDRIYFGSHENASKILTRLNFVKKYLKELSRLNYAKKKGLNGEWLMRYVVQKQNLKPFCVPLFTKRLRVNSIQKERLFSHPIHWMHEKVTFIGLLRYWKYLCLNRFK